MAAPTATIVVANTTLRIGQTSTVTFTFSEAVSGFTLGDLIVANGDLSGLSSADGGVTWTATLTPSANVSDATNLITLDNSGVSGGGVPGVGTTNSNNYTVDTVRPVATTIVVADTSLTAGETSLVTITFSERIAGLDTGDLTVANGTISGLTSADGGATWTGTLTPSASVNDATNLIILDNAGIMDLAGNVGTGTTSSNNYAVLTASAPVEPPPPVLIVGTPFSDVMSGNSLDNVINGGEGNDTISGLDGADQINGGDGSDSLHGNAGADTLTGGGGNDLLLGGRDNDFIQGNTGNDTLSGDLGNDTVHGGQGADEVYGREGDDVLFGDAGDDIVRGGQGDDQIFGGAGNDFLSGDRGTDTLTGGEGADRFHIFAGAGRDVVIDFSLAQGDRVQLLSGAQYSTAQVGGDAVITLTSGDQLVLQGVQLASLGEGWILT
ncbi:MAG: Ig-like domain-containing protein [Phenylobacterium sp.]|uniref:Ig-like domain-containing protein n=1 Tax=Phenylobacterium sp. TaxID=1871053 RepID=UPI002736FE21|nr:Ig-like domain-containing protein [Phenylobacterium sp.]MDP1642899.1 Ig-like domain-containing protein [Phenylobacterium sp.]MDP3117494.1 Ig-like domain-containing protein [Phenylobacterium sp.]